MSRISRVVLSTFVALILCAGLPGRALADGEVSAVDFVRGLTNPLWEDRGLVSAGVDDEVVTVYWDSSRQSASGLAMTMARNGGLSMKIVLTPYSIGELRLAQALVISKANELAEIGFPVVAAFLFRPDVDGILVMTTATDREALAAKSRELSEQVGVPITLTNDELPELTYTRNTDYAPFLGGGLMYNPPDNTICSSGFGVTYQGQQRVTTARHCKGSAYQAYSGSNLYGGQIARSNNGGAAVLSGQGNSMVFTGPIGSSSTKGVGGVEDVVVGQRVCPSGGNSGEHCIVKVIDLGVLWNDGIGFMTTIRATEEYGRIAVVRGDSGGPVYRGRSDGKVNAVGVIQAGSDGVACSGVVNSSGCYKTVWFTSIRTVTDSIPAGSNVLTR